MLPAWPLSVIAMVAFRRSSTAAAGPYSDVDAIMSEFAKIRGDGSTGPQPPASAAAEGNVEKRWPHSRESLGTLTGDERTMCTNDAAVVAVAPSGRPDDTPCSALDGPWFSVSFDTVFRVTVTDTVGRLDLRTVASDWTGTAEALFGAEGPVTAIISKTDTATVATFVGHCRVVDGVDSIIGTRGTRIFGILSFEKKITTLVKLIDYNISQKFRETRYLDHKFEKFEFIIISSTRVQLRESFRSS